MGQSKNLILNTYNPSDLDGFSYAFVELTPGLAEGILKRRDLFRSIQPERFNGNLRTMEYSDYSAVFLSGLPDEATVKNCDAGGDFDETDLGEDAFKDLAERTECQRMVITDSHVYWTAYPKHCDRALTVETNQLGWDVVEEVAGVTV